MNADEIKRIDHIKSPNNDDMTPNVVTKRMPENPNELPLHHTAPNKRSLPSDRQLSLYHSKTLRTAIELDEKRNKWFEEQRRKTGAPGDPFCERHRDQGPGARPPKQQQARARKRFRRHTHPPSPSLLSNIYSPPLFFVFLFYFYSFSFLEHVKIPFNNIILSYFYFLISIVIPWVSCDR